MSLIGEKFDGTSIVYTGGLARGTAGVAARVYNVVDYGAVCDGSTDDTAAVQAACTAAELTGGVVQFPRGRCKITQGFNFVAGVDGSNKAVWIEGEGHHCCEVLFYPTTLSDNCFTWGNHGGVSGTAYYFGGGTRDICIRNPLGTCTGAGVFLDLTIHAEMRDSYVKHFSAGTGLKVRSNGSNNTQHLYLCNVYLQQNSIGWDCESATATVAVNLKINQNTSKGMVMSNTGVTWLGGVLQGSSSGSHTTWDTCANVTIIGVHVEVLAATVVMDLSGCSHFVADNIAWSNAATPQSLIKATLSRNIYLDHIDVHSPGVKLELTGSSTAKCSSNGGASAHSIGAGCFVDWVADADNPSGFRMSTVPSGVHALALGAPLQLPSYTTTQMNALASPQAGWVIYNSTTGTQKTYNGSSWV